MKRKRQQEILDIISKKPVATQQELAREVARRGFKVTQSSISRDIVEIGLAKVDGRYTAPQAAIPVGGPVMAIDTAGDNIIVVKTETGQAQPAALAIDRADIAEIVGTVAGDDTIIIAVKNQAAQRLTMKKIVKLFSRPAQTAKRAEGRSSKAGSRALWSW